MSEEKRKAAPSLFDNLEDFTPQKKKVEPPKTEEAPLEQGSKEKTLKFGIQQIFVETDKGERQYVELKRADFEGLSNGGAPRKGSLTAHSVYWEYHVFLTADYLWVAATHGKTRPYNPKLTNVEDGTKRENTRNLNETEMNSYYFGLFHFQTGLLYQYPSQSAFFPKLLKNHNICNEEKFYTRDLYIPPPEFLKRLKIVTEISFMEKDAIYNQRSDERRILCDLTGVTTPSNFKLTIAAEYRGDGIKGFLGKLLRQYGDDYYSDLVIKGLDDQNAGMVLRKEAFQKYVEVRSATNANGLYSPPQIAKIRNRLLGKINATQND